MTLSVPDTPNIYTKTYSKFRGVDFSSDEVNIYNKRSPDAVNMMPDAGGNPYKRKGWEVLFNNQRSGSATQIYPASGTESLSVTWDYANKTATLTGTDTYTGSTQLSDDVDVRLNGSRLAFKSYNGQTATIKNSENEEAGTMTFTNGQIPSIVAKFDSISMFGLADRALTSTFTIEPQLSLETSKSAILQSSGTSVTVNGGISGLTVGRTYELRNSYGQICKGKYATGIAYSDMSTIVSTSTYTASKMTVASTATVTIKDIDLVSYVTGRLYRITGHRSGLSVGFPYFIGRLNSYDPISQQAVFVACEGQFFNCSDLQSVTIELSALSATSGFTDCTFGSESSEIDNIEPYSTTFSVYSYSDDVKITTADIDKLTDGSFVLWQSASNNQSGTLEKDSSGEFAEMEATSGWLYNQVVYAGNTITGTMTAVCGITGTTPTLKASTTIYGGSFDYLWPFEYGGKTHLLTKCGKGIYDADLLIADKTSTTTPTQLIDLASSASRPLGVYFNAISGASFYMLADARLYKFSHNSSQESVLTELAEPTTYSNGSPNDNTHIYIPTTLIGITAGSEGGTVNEDVNLLTRRRINEFFGASSATSYYVDSDIAQSSDKKVIVSILSDSGTWVTSSSWTVSGNTGTGSLTVDSTTYTFTVDFSSDASLVTFSTAPPESTTGNVRIDFYADGTYAAAEAFKKCTTATVYNNRVFFSGSEGDYKSYVWYSYYEKLTYIPDLNYFVVGDDYTSVMGLIDLGEYLGVIKESSSENSTVYLAYPITFDENTAYAVKQSVTGVGALAKDSFNSLNGEQLFLSDDGIYGISADMDEDTYVASTSVKNRSYYINKKLFAESKSDLTAAKAVVWDGFYCLFVGDHIYILDGSQKLSWENDRTNLLYESYYLEINSTTNTSMTPSCVCVYDGCIYFGTVDGKICRFKTKSGDAQVYSDNTGASAFSLTKQPIKCRWSTVLDNDGSTQYYKNLQKKGTMVTIQPLTPSTVTISLRKDTTKSLVHTADFVFGRDDEELVPRDCYLKKKIKKYKRLQIIVENNQADQGFGIQEIIKCYTVGNYSKNGGSSNG